MANNYPGLGSSIKFKTIKLLGNHTRPLSVVVVPVAIPLAGIELKEVITSTETPGTPPDPASTVTEVAIATVLGLPGVTVTVSGTLTVLRPDIGLETDTYALGVSPLTCPVAPSYVGHQAYGIDCIWHCESGGITGPVCSTVIVAGVDEQ